MVSEKNLSTIQGMTACQAMLLQEAPHSQLVMGSAACHLLWSQLVQLDLESTAATQLHHQVTSQCLESLQQWPKQSLGHVARDRIKRGKS